jgi:hypothetical protein
MLPAMSSFLPVSSSVGSSALGAWSADALRAAAASPGAADAAAWFDAPSAGPAQTLHGPDGPGEASPEQLTARFLDALLTG